MSNHCFTVRLDTSYDEEKRELSPLHVFKHKELAAKSKNKWTETILRVLAYVAI